MLRRISLVGALAATAAVLATVSSVGAAPQPLALTHGVASGDVTGSDAIVWARTSDRAQVHVEYATDASFAGAKSRGSVAAAEATDYTAQVELNGLAPDTRYWYRVWLSGAGGSGRSRVEDAHVGTFKTAAAASQSDAVSFLVGGDLGGQRYCRNAATNGYRIFASMEALAPDFFVANGDMIYADGECPAAGPAGWTNIPGDFPSIAHPSVDWTDEAAVREIYYKHWRYNRADPYVQSFFDSVPMIAQWDDHEVINDFGARWSYWNRDSIDRAGYQNLVEAGRDSLSFYSPMQRNSSEPDRIYRSFRHGKDLELFVLDARSYRDRNDEPDSPGKSMLGEAQIAWLLEGLRTSDATWKVVSSDVPISIPTGSVRYGRDAWANLGGEPTGFEQELLRLLADLDRANLKNIVFVTTDVHFAENIRYQTDADGDGDTLELHELVTGPLNAVRGRPRPLDDAADPTPLYAEGGFFNFGYARIARQADGKVHFLYDVRDENGAPRPGSFVDLIPD